MTTDQKTFPEEVVQDVWEMAVKINGYHSNVWRTDRCGAVIKRQKHGDTSSKHGWEIDHIVPASKGGSDDIDNLQPLYWKNNRAKGDGVLVCVEKTL